MKTKRKLGRVSARIPLAAMLVATGLMHAEKAHAQSTLLFDNLSNAENGVSGATFFYSSGTFVGGAYVLPSGTTQIAGFDLAVVNGTSSTYKDIKVTAYIWGAVNLTTALSSTTPAFSDLLDQVTGTVSFGTTGFAGSTTNAPIASLDNGAPGAAPFFTLGSPLNLPTGVTTVGVALNVQGSTNGLTYASATGLTPLITGGNSLSAGGEYTFVYLNTGGETTGNFNEGPYEFNNETNNAMALRLYGTVNSGPDQWTNSAGGAWEDGTSWASGSAPSASSDAGFNLSSSGYFVSLNQANACADLFVQNDTVTLNINSTTAALSITNALTVGQPGTGSTSATGVLNLTNTTGAYVNISSGSIAVGGNGGTGTLTVGSFVNLITTGTTTVAAGSALNISGGKLLIPSLSLAGGTGAWTGKLDVGTGSLDLANASLDTVSNQAAQGYNGGTWNASGGITSAAAAADTLHLTAVGVISNNVNGSALYSSTSTLGMFEGLNSGLNDVLVKYTYYGDANLDGVVDGSDYSLIDATYLAENFVNGVPTIPISGWYNGDFNYDGVVDGSDYTLMDNAFNMQGSSLEPDLALANSGADGGAASGFTVTPISGAETPGGWENAPSSGVIAYSDLSIANPTTLIGSTSVPEPALMGTVIWAAVGLLGRRRRDAKSE